MSNRIQRSNVHENKTLQDPQQNFILFTIFFPGTRRQLIENKKIQESTKGKEVYWKALDKLCCKSKFLFKNFSTDLMVDDFSWNIRISCVISKRVHISMSLACETFTSTNQRPHLVHGMDYIPSFPSFPHVY